MSVPKKVPDGLMVMYCVYATMTTVHTHLLDGVHALDDLSEDDVLAVEPGGLGGAQEELAAVGVGAGVGHGQDARTGVLQLEVLVLELHPVDGLAAGAVPGREVAALQG